MKADNRSGLRKIFRFPAPRSSSVSYPNGVTQEYGYSEQYRLLSVAHKKSGVSLAHFSYALDPAGHRTQLKEQLPLVGSGTAPAEVAKGYDYDTDSTGIAQTFPRLYRLTQESWNVIPQGQ